MDNWELKISTKSAYENLSSLSFDGTNDKMQVDTPADLQVAETSISLWFKHTSGGSGTSVLAYWNGGGYRIQYATSNRKIVFGVYDGAWDDLTADDGFAAGQWNHLVCTYAAETSKIYLNGVEVKSKGSVGAPNFGGNATVTFGATFSSLWASAILDQVRIFDRALTAPEISDLYRYDIAPSGLIGQWLLDEGSGALALDTGVIENASALSFDGNDSVALSPYSMDGYTAFTIAMWVKPTSTNASQTFLSNDGSGWDNSIQFGVAPEGTGVSAANRVAALFQDTATSSRFGVVDTADVSTTEWTHYVYTYDGSDFKLYRNGALVATTEAVGKSVNSKVVTLGRNDTSGGIRYFTGKMDLARIWDKALTADEVAALHSEDTAADGVVVELLLNEGSGTDALDTSGNDNDGAITGATYTSTDTPLANNGTVAGATYSTDVPFSIPDDPTTLPCPTSSFLRRIENTSNNFAINGRNFKRRHFYKNGYEIRWDFMKPEDYEALEAICNKLETKTLTYEKFSQSADGVEVLADLSPRTPKSYYGKGLFYSEVVLSLTEVGSDKTIL